MSDIPLYLVRIGIKDIPSEDHLGYPASGLIGEETNVFDVNNEMIHVGDIVKVTKENGWWTGLIIYHDSYKYGEYYTITGMASSPLKELSKTHKIERVVPYTYLNQEYRRHIHYIALSEKYLDTSYNFVNGVWTKVK